MIKQPSYRFVGFEDEWKEVKVSDIFRVTRGQVLATTQISEEKTDTYKYPVYSSQTKNEGLLGYYDKYLFETAITWTTDGANAGTVNYREGKFYSTNVNGVLLSDEGFANKVIAEILNNEAWKYVSKVGNPKLMNNVMSEISLVIPNDFREISILSTFFQDIDQLISLQQRKLEVLKEQKKTYLKLLFPAKGQTKPALRFAGFEDEWKEVKLGEVTERITRKNKHLESTLPLTISAQYGLIDQETFFNKKVASKDVSGYYLLKRGEFAYNKSYSSEYPWGAVKRLDNYEKGILSPLYIVFKPKFIDSDFLAVYYASSNWHKEVSMRASEGARNHGLLNISPQDFFDTELIVPISSAEQEAIGSFFQDLDKAIAKQEEKVNQLKESKQTLLRKMFI